MTYTEMAAMVRKEGRLGTKALIDGKGLRCVLGVLQDWRRDENGGLRCNSIVDLRLNYMDLIDLNNNFVGTPEERCDYMANILERLDADRGENE